MKTFIPLSLSSMMLITMSACVQPTSDQQSKLMKQSAGPQKLHSERDDATATPVCRTVEGSANLSEIGEGAEALFQILLTDPEDLTTVHERANRLVELEQIFSDRYALDCKGAGLSTENTSLRIEKLSALAKETDPEIIRVLAKDIWDLFNPNIETRSDEGTSSANPSLDSVAP